MFSFQLAREVFASHHPKKKLQNCHPSSCGFNIESSRQYRNVRRLCNLLNRQQAGIHISEMECLETHVIVRYSSLLLLEQALWISVDSGTDNAKMLPVSITEALHYLIPMQQNPPLRC